MIKVETIRNKDWNCSNCLKRANPIYTISIIVGEYCPRALELCEECLKKLNEQINNTLKVK